jgi:hypothetical protein
LLPDQGLQHGRRREDVAALVVGEGVEAVLRDVDQRVQADDVGRAEHAALRLAGRGAEHHVDLLDGVALGGGDGQRAHHRERADAVGYEVGRVLGAHEALAQQAPAQRLGARDGRGRRVGAGDDLDELEVAGRVEEVRDAEAALERVAAPLHQLGDAQAGRVRRHDGLAAQLVDARVELLFDGEVLDHGLDDEVALGDGLGQVVLEVARGDERLEARREERRGLRLARAFESLFGNRRTRFSSICTCRSVLRGDVEQTDPQARVCQVRRDGRSHDSRSQDRDFVEGLSRGHTSTLPEIYASRLCGGARARASHVCGRAGSLARASPDFVVGNVGFARALKVVHMQRLSLRDMSGDGCACGMDGMRSARQLAPSAVRAKPPREEEWS